MIIKTTIKMTTYNTTTSLPTQGSEYIFWLYQFSIANSSHSFLFQIFGVMFCTPLKMETYMSRFDNSCWNDILLWKRLFFFFQNFWWELWGRELDWHGIQRNGWWCFVNFCLFAHEKLHVKGPLHGITTCNFVFKHRNQIN